MVRGNPYIDHIRKGLLCCRTFWYHVIQNKKHLPAFTLPCAVTSHPMRCVGFCRGKSHVTRMFARQCVQKLLFVILEVFPSCFQLWDEELMACQTMSCALLNYIRLHLDLVNTTHFPRVHLMQFLRKCSTISKGEVPNLCEVWSVV